MSNEPQHREHRITVVDGAGLTDEELQLVAHNNCAALLKLGR